MNALIRLSGAALLASVATACATTQQGAATAPTSKNLDPDRMVVDSAYVAQIERAAQSRGALIRWVNAPVKRAGNDKQ